MPDRLIRYEALENVLNAAISATKLATQKAGLADQKAALADEKAKLAAEKAGAAEQLSRTLSAAADGANAAKQAAYNAADSASQAAIATTTVANGVKANSDYAKQQGDYAKQQADYAREKATAIGDMSRLDYDNGGTAPRSVDNARKLGGYAPTAFVQAGTDNSRVRATDSRKANPGELSTALGHARFRLGSLNLDGSAPFVDALDLSTYGDGSAGGVNSLQFRKDQQRIVHRYGVWGATSWSAPRELAYLDEVIPKSGDQKFSVTFTATSVLWGENATRSELMQDAGAKNPSGNYFLGSGTIQNRPGFTGASRTQLLHIADPNPSTNSALQLAAPQGVPELYFRNYANDTTAPQGNFTAYPWNRVWHSGNLDPTKFATKGEVSAARLGNFAGDGNLITCGGTRMLEWLPSAPNPNGVNPDVSNHAVIRIGDKGGEWGISIVMQNPTYIQSLYAPSKRELKTGICSYEDDAVAAINDLDVVRFAYKDCPESGRVGIIADDTHNADFVGEQGDGLNLQNTIGVLLRAVQQLSQRLEAVENA